MQVIFFVKFGKTFTAQPFLCMASVVNGCILLEKRGDFIKLNSLGDNWIRCIPLRGKEMLSLESGSVSF